jgi:type IV secretory pathway VirB10-like protein
MASSNARPGLRNVVISGAVIGAVLVACLDDPHFENASSVPVRRVDETTPTPPVAPDASRPPPSSSTTAPLPSTTPPPAPPPAQAPRPPRGEPEQDKDKDKDKDNDEKGGKQDKDNDDDDDDDDHRGPKCKARHGAVCCGTVTCVDCKNEESGDCRECERACRPGEICCKRGGPPRCAPAPGSCS